MGSQESRSRNVRIILGVILVLSLLCVGFFLANIAGGKLMEYGVRIYSSLAAHLWAPITLPNGVFYLLLLSVVGTFLFVERYLFKSFFGKGEVWRQYRMDTFFWAEWQWKYSWKGKVANLWCECEKCAKAMRSKVVPDGDDDFGVRFVCDQCGKQSTTIRSVSNEREALERVEKKILRKIRVGKYRGVIEERTLEDKNSNSS